MLEFGLGHFMRAVGPLPQVQWLIVSLELPVYWLIYFILLFNNDENL